MLIKNITDCIGNTPLKHLHNIYKGKGRLYGKMEYLNPGGSMKDRNGMQIIQDALADGRLKKGQTVLEMTSGNMGAGLALACQVSGNPFVAVMPAGNSPERRRLLKALGSQIHLVDPEDGEMGKVTKKDVEKTERVAKQLAEEMGAFYVNQFYNKSSLTVHYNMTGMEIWRDLQGKVDGWVASIGSGGTFLGVGRYLKEQNPEVKCVAVEPENVAFLKTGKVKNPKHIIQGTSYGLVPPHWDHDLADDFVTVTDEEVRKTAQQLARLEGCYVGYSSGANVAGAIKYLERVGQDINVVAVLCDTAFKYSDL